MSYFFSQGALHALGGRMRMRVDLENGLRSWHPSWHPCWRATVASPSVYEGATSAQEVWDRAAEGAPLGDPAEAVGGLLYTDHSSGWNLSSVITAAGDGLRVEDVTRGAAHLVVEGGGAYRVDADGQWIRMLPGGAVEPVAPAPGPYELVLRLDLPRAVVVSDGRGVVQLFLELGAVWEMDPIYDFDDGLVEDEGESTKLATVRALRSDGWQVTDPWALAGGDTVALEPVEGPRLEALVVGNIARGTLVPRVRDAAARHFVIAGEAIGVVDGDALWPWTVGGEIDHEIPADGVLEDDPEVLIELGADGW